MSGKKKRGLSVDDKRGIILSIYHEAKEPFNLKELENHATKKGVVTQTVKDVNQSLIDDNLVSSDKIGSANFFWSFPAKVYQDKFYQKQLLSQNLEVTQQRVRDIETAIAEAKLTRKDPSRPMKLDRLNALVAHEREIDKVIDENKMNDPEEIRKLEENITTIANAVNRWTDNIYSIRSYLVKKKGMSGKEVDRHLNIDDSFDYITIDEPQKKKSKA